jgi:hypothetical protein
MNSEERLAHAAAQLGLPVGRLNSALDAVAGGRARARLRGADRQHRVTDAVATELGVSSDDLCAALGRQC